MSNWAVLPELVTSKLIKPIGISVADAATERKARAASKRNSRASFPFIFRSSKTVPREWGLYERAFVWEERTAPTNRLDAVSSVACTRTPSTGRVPVHQFP